MKLKDLLIFALLLCLNISINAQKTALHPSWLFDGNEVSTGKSVIIEGNRILAIEDTKKVKGLEQYQHVDLSGQTLMPGMIEGHSHLLLHPYNETSWNDQVLKESEAERSIRAAEHAKATVMAGFTTIRDLGSEGADYADVGIKSAINKGVIVGPRMIIATRAIVASGSYGPKGFHDRVHVPLGAETADGMEELTKVVRTQIGNGADVVKVYADYRWGPNKEARPTFSLEELKHIVAVASSSGRKVVAHAASHEGIRRAALAGVTSIEHGDALDEELAVILKEQGVALCPTLNAVESILSYGGWKKGVDEEPERIKLKKESFAIALKVGVEIIAGSDVGVFTHGKNYQEALLMKEYGMNNLQVLRAFTSINAGLLNLSKLGKIQEHYLADLIIVKGNPADDLMALGRIEQVILDGIFIK